MTKNKTQDTLEEIYQRLFSRFGPQHWWPGQTQFEVIVGAILTQNTNWANVEKAIKNLKKSNFLKPRKIKDIPLKRLARLIRPSGYFNIKAKRIKNFVDFLFKEYRGSLKNMFEEDYLKLRAKLLQVKGIGLETADSILLYAGEKPIFVVDAYTKRVFLRHNLIEKSVTYSDIQNIFMDNLSCDVKLFNEYHALIVKLGKDICKKVPQCHICPIREINREIKYVCDSCGKNLDKPQSRYVLKIELFASPEIEITKEQLKKDSKQEIKELLEQMKDTDSKQLEEEVYVFYKLTLCKRCRDIFNQRIKNKEFV
ncbi:MAG: endonuclease III domain-containing protein [Candidatus Omnitrophota bacterium]